MIIPKNDFIKLFSDYGFDISDKQYNQFLIYSDFLVEYNKVCNLTAITDAEGITVKHFLDSVLPFREINLKGNESIIDVGTGAGFPSMPLKIIYPDLKITMLDALNKRVKFLTELANNVESSDALAVHGRAEETGRNENYREKYDIATARAVASLHELCEYCLPFVKVGGYFIALKGSSGKEELKDSYKAIQVLGGKEEKTVEYTLPNGDRRTLIVIKKISHTLAKYPRNKGQMTKKPLI